MKYYINEELVSEEEFESQLEEAVRTNVEENYDDMLDECYPEVLIGNCTFSASQILKNCDPIAYECGIDDFVDGDLTDALYNFREEYEDEINGITFRTEEEVAEDEE